MARIFRRQRTAQPIADLNVTNLIDLGFTLLIIFMIATPLIQQEQTIPVNLPAETKRTQTKPPPGTEFRAVSIDRAGRYYLDGRLVSVRELGSTFAAYSAREKDKQPVIRIRADLTLQWQQVVKLMDEIRRHNLTKITFDTQSEG